MWGRRICSQRRCEVPCSGRLAFRGAGGPGKRLENLAAVFKTVYARTGRIEATNGPGGERESRPMCIDARKLRVPDGFRPARISAGAYRILWNRRGPIGGH